MIKSATKKFKIDLKNSYVIGDSWRDIGAGKRSGCKTIFINRDKNNIKIKRYKPDFKIKNLSTLKKIIEI